MPKLGYKPDKDDDVAIIGGSSDDMRYPSLCIGGKNLKLAKLDKLSQVGKELEATVKLKVRSISKSDNDDNEYSNDIRFDVTEFYFEDSDKDAEQETYEKNLTGSKLSKKKPSAKEALGDY